MLHASVHQSVARARPTTIAAAGQRWTDPLFCAYTIRTKPSAITNATMAKNSARPVSVRLGPQIRNRNPVDGKKKSRSLES